jgi:hypothetical protein
MSFHSSSDESRNGDQLINAAYGSSLRKGLEKRLHARGVQFTFNEYIDDISEAGVVGVTTRSGKHISDVEDSTATTQLGQSTHSAYVQTFKPGSGKN